jgi:EAL domain-containing protein (putative c-di-GMP-specific phosphodiesterase class I)
LSLSSERVSQVHAEVVREDGSLLLCDLGSTNGTFLNHRRLNGPARLADGDIIHLADLELRVVRGSAPVFYGDSTLELRQSALPRRLPGRRRELRALVEERALEAVFQPIVELESGEVAGYEALTRGTAPDLPARPEALFAAAAACGLLLDLCQVSRQVAVEQSAQLPRDRLLFLNSHPLESADPRTLVPALAALRELAGGRPLVVEIHETAASDLDSMRRLEAGLREQGLGFAYDDFGSGQARLLELAEVPPDYLKFDRRLVTGLESAPPARHRLLETLVSLAEELGIPTLAEGVERPEEVEACRAVGFRFAQGFYFGKPQAAPQRAER